MTAVNVAAAIDALLSEAATDEEISRMDIDRADDIDAILKNYEKHGMEGGKDAESDDRA